MQLHLVFGFKLYHLGTIPVESHSSKWHVLRLQEKWINTCCNLVTFYWETPHPQRFAWRTFREGHWVVLKLISLLQILGVQQYPQGGWARYISSGRMSSWTIYFVFGMPFLCWLLPQYPQGGWARHISSVRMSSRIEFCSLYNNFYVGCFHNILKEDELVTYPQ